MKPELRTNDAKGPSRLPPELAAELKAFESTERERLGLASAQRAQWADSLHRTFTRSQRASTTILVAGLTQAHDLLLAAALRPLGYQVETLPTPDDDALQQGKAYCDRAMCNPAYYVVGNLLRHLVRLRDVDGLATSEINRRYLSVTANGCGPCRYGLYITQYRKALREIGFDGFRVIQFDQRPESQRIGEEEGLDMNARLLFHVGRAFIIADVLNLLKYRTRPYELDKGATDAAVARSCARIGAALEGGRGLVAALRQARREFSAIAVDRGRIKPKVAIIGEIWAQTTEGDGNYRLPSFLEEEGAEVETQPLTVWLLSRFWEPRYDLVQRARMLSGSKEEACGRPRGIWWKVPALRAGEGLVRLVFALVARLAGLRGYTLPNIDELSKVSAPYYDPHQKGGEMFMEVGKMLQYSAHTEANMVVSVKPFGCMPSSSVSDGVQSLVTERHPQTQFVSVETTGDGAVNVYSRLQMQYFKAAQSARAEAERALAAGGLSRNEAIAYLKRNPRLNHPLHNSPRRFSCSAANLFHEIGRRPGFRLRRLWRALGAQSA
ncbi:MAG: 2-hydroxyglutaryl-CoA dehydratase [SAR324 cluster bacterium]